MIASALDYQKAQKELRALEERLARLQQTHPGVTKAGIREMIVCLHKELALYEGSEEARHTEAK